MIEEPYRWLDAIENRREYVREQLKSASPVFACKLNEGILLLGVGSGNSKVFELFDRHALTALGHPADLEKIRQAAIDAAHMEAFTRAPEDVSLRRLVSFGLSPQLKTNFEQIFSAPFLIELLLAELGNQPAGDTIVRVHYDGSFEFVPRTVAVAAPSREFETAAADWLNAQVSPSTNRDEAIRLCLEAWWMLREQKSFTQVPSDSDRNAGWREGIKDRVVEIGWLGRATPRPAKFTWLQAKL